MDIKSTYKNMTNVDIDKAEHEPDERSKGYFGEFLVLQSLFDIDGTSKFLMNLEIPSAHSSSTTEIDLVLIHNTGIYVFEIKHYKGTIYGSAAQRNWVQFFKTVKNNSFYSPVLQNQGHIDALRRIIPDQQFESEIIFTHPECTLRVKKDGITATVCTLDEFKSTIGSAISGKASIYTSEQINDIYETLLPFSKVVNTSAPLNDVSISLPAFIDLIVTESKARKKAEKDRQKKNTIQFITVCIATMLVCLIATFAWCSHINDKASQEIAQYKVLVEDAKAKQTLAEKETQKMQHNFQHVEPYNGGNIKMADDFISVSDVSLKPSKNIKDASAIYATIGINGTGDLGIRFNDASKLVVQLFDGHVLESNLWENNTDKLLLHPNSVYNASSVQLGNLSVGHEKVIYADFDDIAYVKITNIDLCSDHGQSVIQDDFEIEIYDAEP